MKDKKRPPVVIDNGRYFFTIRWGRAVAAVTVLIALAVLVGILIFDAADDFLALTGDSERILVTVEELSELPRAMSEAGVIRYPFLFELYMSAKGGELKRNAAVVSDDMDYRALFEAFVGEEPIRTVRLTFSGRMSVEQVIELFVTNGIGSREGFVRVINEYPFDFDFVERIPVDDGRLYRLEGYLYPDTYDFYTGRSEEYYVERMLRRFDDVTKDIDLLCTEKGMTLDEALTVASLIECSAGYPSDYERMSSVIFNRLKSDLPLEIPASSVYGLTAKSGLFKGVADESVKSLDSPYNTYKKEGLPPGAICNPTREAMLCALMPEESRYLYFITRDNGRVLFALTRGEHHENVSKQ